MFATFSEIKEAVRTIVDSYPHISDDYTGPKTGIYMLYIDDFSDNSIIPIYVGKTLDFKQRLYQHQRDIGVINTMSFADYQMVFLRGAYEMRCPYDGKYKACKIFKYMLDHQCSWKKLRMTVLEPCEKGQLAEKEEFWISKLYPAYVGFNQIDSITLQWNLRNQPQQQRALALKEAELFRQYLDYGYSAFNYLCAFTNNPYNPYKEELDQRSMQRISGPFLQESPQKLMEVFGSLYEDYEKAYRLAKTTIEERYAPVIHELFLKHKIKSKIRENEVIELMVNSDPHNIIPTVYQTKEYLRYYMAQGKARKTCGVQLDEYIRSQSSDLSILTSQVKITYQLWVNHISKSIASSRYGLIFPDATYEIMPIEQV